MRSLIFTPEAGADLRQAYRWYEEQRSGLGAEFSRAVEATTTHILRRPDAFRAVSGPFRCAPVRRFPYVVCDEFDSHKVLAVVVFHTSQNPNKLRRRLSGN